jgi:hypothetical protein
MTRPKRRELLNKIELAKEGMGREQRNRKEEKCMV